MNLREDFELSKCSDQALRNMISFYNSYEEPAIKLLVAECRIEQYNRELARLLATEFTEKEAK